MSNFSKNDLARAVAVKLDITISDATELIEQTFSQIVLAVQNGQRVNIAGFGKFAMKDRPARMARNPRTGEVVEVPARQTLGFKPSKTA